MRHALLASLLLLVLVPTLPTGAEPILTFTERSVVVDGTTPGADVAVLTVWRERFPGWSRTTRFAELLPDPENIGRVELVLGREIPQDSLWIAADLVTGEFAVATPRSHPFPEMEPAARRLNPSLEGLEADRETLELMFVRPGEGAWHLTVWDGGTGDEDATPDGRLRAFLPSLEPLGLAPPLQRPRPGDLVFGIEARRMEWFASAIGHVPPQH